jgi:hypothetical protein
MRLCHPPVGSTSPKYKLLYFITTKKICNEMNAPAFNQDRCCHLVLSLRLIPFHCFNQMKWMSVYISMYFSVFLSLCFMVSVSFCLSVSLSISPSVILSLCLLLSLSLCFSLSLSHFFSDDCLKFRS